jgi:hypothetical protein
MRVVAPSALTSASTRPSVVQARQGRLAGDAPLRAQPVDLVADPVPPHLDAAVVGVGGDVELAQADGGVGQEALDLGQQGRAVALEREQPVAAALDDRARSRPGSAGRRR